MPAIYCFGEIDADSNSHSKWNFEGIVNMRNLKKFFKGVEDTKLAGKYLK